MPKITDTYAQAYECCDRVLQETERFPTIDSIRERIGVNSPTTIKKAINDWTVAFARKHFEQLHRPKVPTVLWNATESLWQLAVQQAEQSFDIKVKQHQSELAGLQQQFTAAAGRAVALDEALASTREQLQLLAQEKQAMFQEAIRLKQDLEALTQQHLDAQQQWAQQQHTHETELTQLRAQKAQELQWYQRRIVEERELQAEQWQVKVRHMDELNQALQHSAQQATLNYQQGRESLQALQKRCQALEAELKTQQKTINQPAWRRKRRPPNNYKKE